MPEPKRPLKVFLCHASKDKPKVRELYRYLKRRGINPWFDEEDLVGGQDWQVEIPKALATSDAIIICLTKNSVDKEGYIQKEIKFALDKALEMPEGRIFLIPVKFEECEVPFSLSRYQWVDLTIESGYAKMMKALKFRASQLERSTVEVSKREVEEENLAREMKESQATERSERGRKDKELREKQVRETRNKENRESEKHEKKPATVKPKARGQFAYWFGGFIVLVLGIVFLSSLNNPPSTEQPTPENTQIRIASTPTQTEIAGQNFVPTNITPTLSAITLTPSLLFTPVKSLDASKKLYFVSKDKYLNVLDVSSGQAEQLIYLEEYKDYLDDNGIFNEEDATLTWFDDTKLAIWLSNKWLLFDIASFDEKIISYNRIDRSVFDGIAPSDIYDKHFILYSKSISKSIVYFEPSGFDYEMSDFSVNETWSDMGNYRSPFCLRIKPEDTGRFALVLSELNESTIGPPFLALVRRESGRLKPFIVKKQVDGCISWSPDGKFLAYGNGKPRYKSAEDFPKGIYYVDVVSGVITKLSDKNGYYPVWSPDGNKIAFITEQGISIVDINTKIEELAYSGDVLALIWAK